MFKLVGSVGPLVLLVCMGCVKEPALESSATESAMRGAQVAGAEDLPQAALHLQLAKEQLAEAQRLNTDGDEERAKSMLTRAAADAELALLLSHEQSEKDEADAALNRVLALRSAE